MKYGEAENHDEYQSQQFQTNSHWEELGREAGMTANQFKQLVCLVIRSHNDVRTLAGAVGVSLSTVTRWATGATHPHPIMYPCIVKSIKKAFHEKL